MRILAFDILLDDEVPWEAGGYLSTYHQIDGCTHNLFTFIV